MAVKHALLASTLTLDACSGQRLVVYLERSHSVYVTDTSCALLPMPRARAEPGYTPVIHLENNAVVQYSHDPVLPHRQARYSTRAGPFNICHYTLQVRLGHG